MAYLPLSTANLPDPVIDPAQGSSPEDYFNTVLYTGNGSTNAITGVGFQPDWVWGKSRSNALNHFLTDAVRGATETLKSNTTDAEETQATALTSFDSDGFTMGSSGGFNGNGYTYVAWNWKANGSGVSNTDGSITSTVSANTESGFSIVTWTGTGANATVGHGLDSAPEMIIAKVRNSGVSFWMTYHEGLSSPSTSYLALNNSNAVDTGGATVWNSTSPTSSVFSVGTSTFINPSGGPVLAYAFHSVEGFSKFGSYTGNGSADGPFVYTGFRPAFVMVKRTDSTANWQIYDTGRDLFNSAGLGLAPNGSAAESDGGEDFDILSNGFKARDTAGARNGSGGTYIYMAFAENPFKYSNAR